MGSLAPQGGGAGAGGGSTDTPVTTVDESISVGVTYANAIVIDSRTVKDSAVILFNDDAVETCDYKIFGTTKTGGSAPIDSDDSWVNILDLEVEPVDYDNDKFKTLPAKGVFYESYSNKWAYVRIQMKASAGTIICKIWHRGIN